MSCFSESKFLISTFTWHLCYRNRESRFKGPLFTYGHTRQGVNNWQFFGKYRIIVVKLKECKIKQAGFNTFQNTRRINQIPALRESNHLFSAKSSREERGVCHIKLFSESSLLVSYLHVFYIKITVKNRTKVLCLYINAPVKG